MAEDSANLQKLAARIGVNLGLLQTTACTASNQYRCWDKKKASGGTRRIEAPNEELKLIQSKILTNLLEKLPMNAALYGRKGTSQIGAAAQHVRQPVVIAMDIKGFFPSVSARTVQKLLLRHGFAEDESELLCRITTRRGRLPQGAPTSSCLAQLAVAPAVERVQGMLTSISPSCRFAMYADDVSLSGPPGIQRTIPTIKKIFGQYGYTFKPRKTFVMKTGEDKIVLNIKVNNRLQPSPDLQRRSKESKSDLSRKGHEAYRQAIARANP